MKVASKSGRNEMKSKFFHFSVEINTEQGVMMRTISIGIRTQIFLSDVEKRSPSYNMLSGVACGPLLQANVCSPSRNTWNVISLSAMRIVTSARPSASMALDTFTTELGTG